MIKKEYLEMAGSEVDSFSGRFGVYSGKSDDEAEAILRARIGLLKECAIRERMNMKTKESLCNRVSTLAGVALMK